ncbi:unnamed protein product, partial [Closterium sp. NIES-65]
GGQGGALYVDTGHLQVLNCLFLRNGDHSECSLGGAMTSRARTVVDNCTFLDNKAQDQGGALHFLPYETLNVSRSRFQGNSVLKQNGGAIHVLGVSWSSVVYGNGGAIHMLGGMGADTGAGTGAVRVESSTFVGNRAERSKGGALYSESVSVTFDNVTLDGNTAALQGGAVAGEWMHGSALWQVSQASGLILDANMAPMALQGGAARWQSMPLSPPPPCSLCLSPLLPHAVYASLPSSPMQSMPLSPPPPCSLCLSPLLPHAVYASLPSSPMQSMPLSPPPPSSLCLSPLLPHAVYASLPSSPMQSMPLSPPPPSSLCLSPLLPHAVYASLPSSPMQSMHPAATACIQKRSSKHAASSFLRRLKTFPHIPPLPSSPVPVYASSSDGLPTEALFKSCRFVRNEAVLGGGAIYTGLGMHTRVHACEVEENNSTGLGGAVLVQEFSRVEMTRTRCHGNIPDWLCLPLPPRQRPCHSGTCLSLLANAHATVTDSVLQANHHGTCGACLSLLANAHATVTNSILSANQGTSEGGAARVSGSAHLSLLSSSILQNTAAWGGAVWVEMGASLLISNNSKLEGNEARYLGGTVYATHVSRVEVQGGSVFRGNSALHGGAMVVEAEARVTAADSTFENNTFSGILFQGFSQGVLRNCSFMRNSNAAGRGGAVLVGDKTTVAVHSCSFSGNWAALGGAVSTEGSPYLTINGSDFTRNIAQIGAGVALAGATAFTMGESVFTKNNATKAGGGVAVLEQVEGEISGSRFEGNYAVVGGAGVYLMRSAAATAAAAGGNRPPRVRLQGLLFDGNSAMDAHGVAFFDASYSPHLRSACQACQMVQQGDTEGSMPADFYLKWPGAAMSSQETGGRFSVVGSVGSMLTGLQVVVVDEFGNIVSKDNSALARVSPDSRISGSLRGTSQGGIITVPPIAVRVPPGGALQPIALTVTVSSTTNAFPDFSHPFNISFCPAGQYFDGESFSCQDCPVGHCPPLPPRFPSSPSLSPQVCARPGHGDVSRPCAPGQGMETCPDGTFTFFPNAVSQEQCTACDDDSLDCRYGTLEISYQNWLDPASLNSTPTTYACLLTEGCSGTTYTGPNTTQCAVGYNNTVP